MQEYKVSDEQGAAVAEYMAGLLLKYDGEYEQDLTPLEEIVGDVTTGEENSVEEKDADVPDTSADTEDSGDNTNNNEESTQEYTLSQVIGEKDFDITYTGYKLSDVYPEDAENTYFSVRAREGYQLLVASFSVKNNSSNEKRLNLSNEDILYQLDINVGKVYKPWLTLLENDLQYIDLEVAGDKSKIVLLVFEISKDADISNINLIISNDNKSKIIELK
jgi:hypothetical protein